MKKKLMLAMIAGAAMLAVTGCSTETEAQTKAQTEAATEAAENTLEGVSEDAPEQTGTESATEAVSEESTEAEVPAVRPEYNASEYVEVGEYKGLPVTVDEITVTEDEITDAVESAFAAAGVYDEVKEGTVEEGDIANIDYVGKKDDVAFEGGTAEGYDLTIGSGSFIDGFEEGLVGVKIGDTVDLNLTFPDPYTSEELAGADVVFTVTVNSVKRTAEISDETVAKATEDAIKTVDEYREAKKAELIETKEAAQEQEINEQLMTGLYNTCKITGYPEDVLAYHVAANKENMQTYADQYGVASVEEFIESYLGMDMATYEAQVEEDVKASLDQEMILGAIAQKEEMQITDEEFDAGLADYLTEMYQQYAEQIGVSLDAFVETYLGKDMETYNNKEAVEEMKASIDQTYFRYYLLTEKAAKFVRENAIVTVSEAETESEIQPEELVTEVAAEAVTEAAEEAATEAGTEK